MAGGVITSAWIQGGLTVAAALVAAGAALKGLRSWQSEAVGRRKIEVAEQIILAGRAAGDSIFLSRRLAMGMIEGGACDGLSEESKQENASASLAEMQDGLAQYHAIQPVAAIYFILELNEFFKLMRTAETDVRSLLTRFRQDRDDPDVRSRSSMVYEECPEVQASDGIAGALASFLRAPSP